MGHASAGEIPRPRQSLTRGSGLERETTAVRAGNQFLGHFLLHQLDEIAAAAVHRDHVVDVELLQFGNDLRQVRLLRRRQVETAAQRVYLLDPGHRLRALQRVDDPAVAARCDDDEPSIPDHEAGGVLMQVLIRHRCARQFLRREMVLGVCASGTPGAILLAEHTNEFGSTFSMLTRGTAPVVKACPSTMIGSSDSTGCTRAAFRSLRSSRPHGRNDPSSCFCMRWQNASSPPR